MKKMNVLFLLLLLPFGLSARIELYGDLKGTFNDTEFKDIFSDEDITACIWVQEYRRNLVYEQKISKETDITMHNRCTEAAISVAKKTEHSMEPVHIDLRHTGKAPDFSNPMKQRYKALFPNWKQTMEKTLNEANHQAKTEFICDTSNANGLDECTKNIGKKNNTENKETGINGTINSLKEITGIFN